MPSVTLLGGESLAGRSAGARDAEEVRHAGRAFERNNRSRISSGNRAGDVAVPVVVHRLTRCCRVGPRSVVLSNKAARHFLGVRFDLRRVEVRDCVRKNRQDEGADRCDENQPLNNGKTRFVHADAPASASLTLVQ